MHDGGGIALRCTEVAFHEHKVFFFNGKSWMGFENNPDSALPHNRQPVETGIKIQKGSKQKVTGIRSCQYNTNLYP
jgi:hypothetical protein